MASETTWEGFFGKVRDCRSCAPLGVTNILTDLRADDAWGLPWYDKHRNLDGGLMIVGMDFGNEETVNSLRWALRRNPNFEPGEDQDKTYVRLRRFLKAASLEHDAFVTNAALCVRAGGTQETGRLSAKIYQNCSSHLRAQISLAKPYAIVALGNDALDFVCDALRTPRYTEGVSKIAGQQRLVRINAAEITLLPFIHPSRQQNAHGWPDERQVEELYKPLRQILYKKEAAVPRADFRARFGILN